MRVIFYFLGILSNEILAWYPCFAIDVSKMKNNNIQILLLMYKRQTITYQILFSNIIDVSKMQNNNIQIFDNVQTTNYNLLNSV